jgi:hypothetical protein
MAILGGVDDYVLIVAYVTDQEGEAEGRARCDGAAPGQPIRDDLGSGWLLHPTRKIHVCRQGVGQEGIGFVRVGAVGKYHCVGEGAVIGYPDRRFGALFDR